MDALSMLPVPPSSHLNGATLLLFPPSQARARFKRILRGEWIGSFGCISFS